MKFKLFGGSDCSDYLLAQLASVAALAETPGIVASLTENAVLNLLGGSTEDQEAAGSGARRAAEDTVVEMMQTEMFAQLDEGELAQAMVAVHAVVESMVKYNVSYDHAVNDMTMLGLPKEGCAEIIAEMTSAQMTKLRAVAVNNRTPARPPVLMDGSNATVFVGKNSSGDDEGHEQPVLVRVPVSVGPSQEFDLDLTPEQARTLLGEMVRARELLHGVVAQE